MNNFLVFLCLLLSIFSFSFTQEHKFLDTDNGRSLQQQNGPSTCDGGDGNLLMTWLSRYYLGIASNQFNGFNCANIQIDYTFHSWCIQSQATSTAGVSTALIWSTIAQQYLGLVMIGNSYQIDLSSTFDASSQTWTFTRDSATGFHTVSQSRSDGHTYYLAQLDPGFNGAGDWTKGYGAGILTSANTANQQQWLWWTGYIGKQPANPVVSSSCVFNIESALFPSTYVRGDDLGTLATYYGIVNMQYGAYTYERWHFEYSGNTATNGNPLFCIHNLRWGVYLTLDGSSCSGYVSGGCGVASTVGHCMAWEQFQIIKNTVVGVNAGTYGIVSNAFPNVAFRLSPSGLTDFSGSGGGVVNGQVINNPTYSTISGTIGSEEILLVPSIEKTFIFESNVFPGVYLSSQSSNIKLQHGATPNEFWLQTPTVQSSSGFFCYFNQASGFFLSLDGSSCTSTPTNSGCGSVSTSKVCTANEMFSLSLNADGTYAFISYAFPNIVLRMDGTGLNAYVPGGAGSVNAQVYPNLSTTGTVGKEAFIARAN